jgi:hypothetical protein
MNIYYELTVDHSQQAEFIHYALYTFLGDDTRFGHFLHRKLLFFLFAFHAPNFAEATSAYRVKHREIVFSNLRYASVGC